MRIIISRTSPKKKNQLYKYADIQVIQKKAGIRKQKNEGRRKETSGFSSDI